MGSVPRTGNDLTSGWLTIAMRDATGDAAITLTGTGPLEGMVSFQGNLIRAELDATGGADVPGTVVVKMVPENEALRGIGHQLGIYAREAAFYLAIGAEAGVRQARCLGAEIDPDTGDSAIVLEDLGHLRTGNQIEGFSLPEAKLAVAQYARMHARWWNDERIGSFDWLPPWNLSPLVEYMPQAYQQAWPACADLFADVLTDAERGLGDLLGEHIADLMNLVGTAPVTLVHGDARHDNLMFDDAGNPPHMVDWQYVATGRGIVDIAYYLTQGGDPGIVTPVERELVGDYHAALVSHGVSNYDLEACWSDYRRLALYTLVFPIFTAALIDPSSDDQRRALGTILKRGLAAAQRLDSAALFSD